jgi:hypothetical protein
MNCLAFEALLDEGTPGRLPEAAMAHARECASCARSLERARALESALERHFSASTSPLEQAALAGFTDRVMARVRRSESRGVRWLTLPDALPWWVRTAAEPSVALASVVSALLLWRGNALLVMAREWFTPGQFDTSRLASLAQGSGLDAAARALWTALAPTTGADWAVAAGVTLGIAPLAGLMGWAMWRAGERLAGGGPLHSLR